MPESFQCGHCHEAVNAEDASPSCQTCGTTYRYDSTKAAHTVVSSRARFYDNAAIGFMVLGIVGLASTHLPSGPAWFCMFAGFALHYWNGIRSGVLSSRFILFRWYWTVYRAETPTAFFLAMIIEGLWVLGFLFIFLFSW